MDKPKIGILIKKPLRYQILSDTDLDKLEAISEVKLNPLERDMTESETIDFLGGVDGAISSWGTVPLTWSIIDSAPELQIWAHAAGSVKNMVAEDAWDSGVVITSAAPAIADDVAELTMACITMGIRKFLPFMQDMALNQPVNRDYRTREIRSLFRATVGVIGASHVGRRVIKLLRYYDTRILLYDPLVTPSEAAEMGAELADLDTISRESDAITCHAPKIPETFHLINQGHFKTMKDDVVFVNTSRGDNIDEKALIKELEKGRLFAFLDVTSPEPSPADSPLRKLPNVALTPHIAGAKSYRTGAMAVEEICRYFAGEPAIHRVTKDMLPTIA